MPERLTDRLVELEVLDRDAAEAALDRQVLQGGALDTSLLELELCSEAQVRDALADAYAAPVADDVRSSSAADLRALRVFPEPWAKKHMLAPLALSEDGTHLEILSPGPTDAGLLARLGELLEIALVPVLAPEFRVWQRLARLYEIDPPERFRDLIAKLEAGEATPSRPATKVEDDATPLGFSEAVNLLREAKDRDEIVRIALRYAHRDLELAAMFINHEDHLEGWMGAGPGAELVPQLKLELTRDSAFRVVLDTQAHYLGPMPSDPSHATVLERLGRARPRGVLIVPVRIRNRTVALLYGENGNAPIPPRLAADLMLFTTHLQMALEGLLMRRKAETLAELRALDGKPVPSVVVHPPPPTPEAAPASPQAAALAQAITEAIEEEPPSGEAEIPVLEPEPAPAEATDEAAEADVAVAEPEPDRETQPQPAVATEEEDPAEAEPAAPEPDEPAGAEETAAERAFAETLAELADEAESSPAERAFAETLAEIDAEAPAEATDPAAPIPEVAEHPDLARAAAEAFEVPSPDADFDPSLDLPLLDLEEATDSGPIPASDEAPTGPQIPPDVLEATTLDEDDPAEDPTPAEATPIEAPVEAEPSLDLDVVEDEPIEPAAEPTLPLLARSDSWAQATLLPEEPDEDDDVGHPLIGDDDGWSDVDAPDLGSELDASISAAQEALSNHPEATELDRGAIADAEDGQAMLDELDALTSSLEEALAVSEAAAPLDPTGEDITDQQPALSKPPVPAELDPEPVPLETPIAEPEPVPLETPIAASGGDDGWDEVDVDEWVGTPPAGTQPIAVPDDEPRAAARASLTEDATLPDLSAEAWIRASSEIVRPRSPAPEVVEAAARPDAADAVPLTRITFGRREAEMPAELREVHANRNLDDRYEAPHVPPPDTKTGPMPILLGQKAEETPIPLTDADRRDPDEPVPLTQLSSGGYAAQAPDEDPFGDDPAIYDQQPPDAMSLEDELAGGPVTMRPMPAETQPVSQAEVQAARLTNEVDQWWPHLESRDAQTQALGCEALVALGPDVLPYLEARFPGPLTLDPFLPDAELAPFAKCGPLLSVLERLGRDAHSLVGRQLDAPKPVHRFFATYFYGAVYVPEAIPRLIQRLHDEEPRICMLAARTLFSYREHPDFSVVLDHLHGRLNASSSVARRHACYLLGLFRDVTAIPDLIEILGRKDKGMIDVAEDALAEITKQRLGASAKKWTTWWNKNRDRSRLAWLVDGLAAKDADLRKSAAEELRAVTGLDMGFDENAPKRRREEARQRWIAWWKEQEGL